MTDITSKDRVFSRPLSSVKAFEFDDEVTRVFDDMIQRSVPGYELLVKLIALYANVFSLPSTSIYDLGCSTGVVARVIDQQANGRGCVIHAVDNSPAMIKKCEQAFNGAGINWICDDVENITIQNASMVVMNLTLQFIDVDKRKDLIGRIYQGLVPGGVLLLTEKVEYVEPSTQQTMTDLYQGFKKIQGYSDLEIAQKRTALENVLIPESKSVHVKRLKQAGFDEIVEAFHCFNFVSWLAIKNGK